MHKLLTWLDDNILWLLSGFLIFFIPVYPKRPLFDVLPGYIVRARLEDVLISLALGIWIVWVIRRKVDLAHNPLLKPISAYLIAGVLSMISAIFIVQTVPMESLHINKMVLHFLRRIEYFSLFFIFYSSVRNLKQIKIYLGILLVTILVVVLYGFGQKYLYWPAFSTMNREFSKGWVLYLTQHARVLSTFGGHYDLAAYIMMVLVLLWSIFFGLRNILGRLLVFLLIAGAFWTLILTASRTSFIAYLFGITVMFLFWAFKRGIRWSILRWVAVVIASVVIMLSFGDLSERFTKLLRIDERLSGLKSLLLSPIGVPPSERAMYLENNPQAALSLITSSSDQPPTPLRPSDVYQDMPLLVPTGTGSATLAAVPRTYSKTAFMYDLSTAIRFDALWPMAINGFKRNPLLGSGYSTLNKTQQTQFTEAESTDNDYLRSLGETGLLGFITFYGTLLIIAYIVWRNIPVMSDIWFFSVAAGFIGLLFGLLVNAVYIDVFESSKVALSFWGLTGFVLAGTKIFRGEANKVIPKPSVPDLGNFKNKMQIKTIQFLKSDLFYVLLILFLAFALRLYKIDTPLADWHSWRQADTSSVTRNYVRNGVNILFPTYDDLSNVASGQNNPKGLRFVEFPLYNVAAVVVDKIFVGFNIVVSGRLTNIFSALLSTVFLFLLVRRFLGRKEAFLSALLFAILPYNIYFTRVILPEPFLVFTLLGSFYFWSKFFEIQEKYTLSDFRLRLVLKMVFVLFLAVIFSASSILIKPFAVFFFLPLGYLWLKRMGINFASLVFAFMCTAVILLPFIGWRWWVSHYPEGVPAYMWLFNGDGIRFKGAFFYWLFADRIGRLILGYWGLPFLVLGIVTRFKKFCWLFYWWGVGALLYLTVVATGNVRHDYYQVLIIPILTVFLARGIVTFLNLTREHSSKFVLYPTLAIVLIFMEMFGWYHVRDFYNINHPEIVEAGSSLERKTKDNVLVIAPYSGDTAFLYQTGRAGWPILQEPIEKMVEMGAQYYVSVTFDEVTNDLIAQATAADPLKRKYKIIEQTPSYAIIQLVPDSKLPK